MPIERERYGQLNCLTAVPDGPELDPPLLLVHGLGGGIWGWEPFQRYFASRGYRSYALELPGHGQNTDAATAEIMGTYSVETYALWVAAAMAEIGRRCVVIGHSMGGLVAQKLAESHRQPGYIFLASAPPWHMFRRAYVPMWRHLLRHPWKEVVWPLCGGTVVLDSSLQDSLVNNRLTPEIRADIAQRDVPDSGRASMQMTVGLVSVDVRRVSSPCLVIAGSDDRLIPLVEQQRLAKFYHSPLQVHDCGHMLMIENGFQAVAEGILQWVASLQPAAVTAD
ncbi:MAG: alpha/beta fold hydrolase [Terriglobales bacterium]